MLTPYAEPVQGGISTVIGGLRRLLGNHGHEIFVLPGQGNGDPGQYSDLGGGALYVRRALSGLRRLSPEIVHCHAHWYTLVAGIRYRRVNPSVRLVFSFHTSDYSRWGAVFSWLLGHAEVLTFVSASQLAELRRALQLGGDLRLLYPGVYPREVDGAAKKQWTERYSLDGSFPILVFVGPLDHASKVRGVIDLVGIADHVRSVYPTTKLLIVGDGKLKGRVLEASEVSEADVQVTGFVRDPSPAYATSDIYCHVSYRESFGIAVLEAMSMGACVLTLGTSGVSEIVNESTGMIVDPEPRQVSQAILKLAADPHLRHELGSGARTSVLRSHTWPARWPKVASIYGLE